MTTDLTVGAVAPTGADGTPSQPVSTPAQPPIDSKVTDLLAGLGGKLDTLTKELGGLQSRQDKAEGKFSDFQNQLAKFNQIKTQGGLSDDQAMEVMQKSDNEAQRWTNLERKLEEMAARITGVGTPANDSNAVTKVFESLGLDLKDTRVASALVRKYDTPEQVELAAYRLQRELALSPQPTSAQGASLQGSFQALTMERNEVLATELVDLQREPTLNRERIDALRRELGFIK
jgi:chromosome segregation ATPase